ncbi:hypothetical protein HYU13_01240 [Candidatus Woesearchaeota archaeon]|nr:hypothetical protein [Candidatus Woesearchaeota archaeon]
MKKIFIELFVLAILMAGAYADENDSPVLKITMLNQEPDPARAGETAELRFRVENIGGGTVENVELEILENYPFTLIDEKVAQKLVTLYAYQTGKNFINTKFKVKIDKDAVKGQHELKARYRQAGKEWVTAGFKVDITSKEFAQIIYVDKSKVEPGKETEMKFTITNIGNAPLQNMVFSWSEPNGALLPVFSDDTKYVKYLDIGDSAELVYIVVADVNAEPGLYKLDLMLSYESLANSTASVIKTKAGVFIGGETDFEVAFSESSQGQTSLSVANTGNNPALSVSVKIPEQSGFRVTGSSSAIIGNLDKGDYTVVSFPIVPGGMGGAGNFSGSRQRQAGQGIPNTGANNPTNSRMAGSGSAGGNVLKVIIDYTDTTGERRSIEKNVAIQFRASSGDPSSANAPDMSHMASRQRASFWQSKTFYGIILLFAAAGLVFYRKKSLREKLIKTFWKR